jgi:AcrR family transcriptional regulator
VEAQAVSTDRAERSRRQILDAAAPIFAEHGYSGASLNRIILASGLTKGGFYFHFASKRDLAMAVVDDHNDRWFRRVLAEVATFPRAIERLFAFPRVLARSTLEGEGPSYLRKLTDELAQDPEIRDEVCGSIRVGVETTAQQFREAQAEGDIRPDIDPDVIAEVCVGSFVGMQTLTEQLADGALERRIEALIDVVRTATATRPQEGGRS